MLHRFVNRQNAPNPVLLLKVGKHGGRPKTPNEAVQQDAEHWAGYWQVPDEQKSAHKVLDQLFQKCVNGLRIDSENDVFDAFNFSVDILLKSAKSFKKVSCKQA